MSTLKEVESQLRKSKKEKRELEQKIKEYEIREKLYLERLDNWAVKNQELNYKINNITIDEVIKIQKAKVEYTEKYLKDKEITDSFEKQSQVKLGIGA